MYKLTEPTSLHARVCLWAFVASWDDEMDILNSFYKNISNAYNQIETNSVFLSVISYTLGIGNVLNGGTPKG